MISIFLDMIYISMHFNTCHNLVRGDLTLSQTSPGLYVSAAQIYWKHCGKRFTVFYEINFSTSNWHFDRLFTNPLPNDKILALTNLKAFADNKFNIAEMIISVCDRVENIVGKGENAGYQHFSPFSTKFSKEFFLRVVKSQDCVLKS